MVPSKHRNLGLRQRLKSELKSDEFVYVYPRYEWWMLHQDFERCKNKIMEGRDLDPAATSASLIGDNLFDGLPEEQIEEQIEN